MSSHPEAASTLAHLAEVQSSRRASPRRELTETERNWIRSLLVVIGSVLVFYLVFLVEMELGRWNMDIRFVRSPSESAMRYLGLSHFFVAILFMSTSRRMRAARSWVWFAISLAIGLVLCVGYSRLGLVNPIIATSLFFTYFLIHDFRDQVFFYFTNGDAQQTTPSRANLISAAPLVLIGALLALLVCAAAFGLPGTEPVLRVFGNADTATRTSVGVAVAIALALGAAASVLIWRKRRGSTSVMSFVNAHRPIFYVLAGSLTVLAISAVLGASGDAIILLHVCAWYVFTIRQLRKREPPVRPAPMTWSWIRSTVAGFNFVHIGSLVLFMVAGLVWSYGFRNDPSSTGFNTIISREMFPYWTILHVSVSFPGR